jgi:hypothetical protein
MKNFWNDYVKTNIEYESKLLWIAFPAFTVVYLIAAYYAGLYDRWYKRSELVKSTLIATIVLLAAYALLPEKYRFSRAIILFGALLAFLLISLLRWALIQAKVLSRNKGKTEYANTLIVASSAEYEKTVQIMEDAGLHERIIGRVAVLETDSSGIGYWKRIKQLSTTVPFREIIFCEGTISFGDIIGALSQLPHHIRIKFHADGSNGIVGSNSKDSSGEAVSKENGYKLGDPYYRRLKRLVDISISLLAIITFPIHFFLVKKPFSFFGHCFAVLLARRTWIGYITTEKKLPRLRAGVIACNGLPVSASQPLPAESLQMMDQWYARDYEAANDLRLIWKIYRRLGD